MASRNPAYVPKEVRPVLYALSKADLMELVWDYALFSVGDSAEDATLNPDRLTAIIERAGFICLEGQYASSTVKKARRVLVANGFRSRPA